MKRNIHFCPGHIHYIVLFCTIVPIVPKRANVDSVHKKVEYPCPMLFLNT